MKIHFLLILFFSFLAIPAMSQENISELIKLANKEKDYKEEIKLYSKISHLYFQNGDIPNTIKYFERANKLREKKNVQDEQYIPDNFVLAQIYKNQGKYKEAVEILNKIKEICLRTNDNNALLRVYIELAENHKKIGNIDKQKEYEKLIEAFDQEKQKEEFKSSINSSRKILTTMKDEKRLLALRLDSTQRALEEKEKWLKAVGERSKLQKLEINLLQKDNAFKESQMREQNALLREKEANLKVERLFRIILIAGMGVVVVVLGLFLMYYQQKKKDHKIIVEQQEKIKSSINYASRIQQAMLPSTAVFKKNFKDSFFLFLPRDVVSGDFYWVHEIPDNKDIVYISAADCTGHGVPGALMSMIGMNQLTEIISSGITKVDAILDELDKKIHKTLKKEETNNVDGIDIALCMIDKAKKQIHYSGAKNNICIIENGEKTILNATKKSIGEYFQRRKPVMFEEKIYSYQSGAMLYLYSDGYSDQVGGKNESKFMSGNMVNLFAEISKLPTEKQFEILLNTHLEWKGQEHEQLDDILVIGIRLG